MNKWWSLETSNPIY